jgi:hypothetical protein
MPAMIDIHTHLGYRKGATFSAENFTRENLDRRVAALRRLRRRRVASAGTDRGELTFQLRAMPAGGAPRPHRRARARAAGRRPGSPMRSAPYGVSSEARRGATCRELAAQKVDFVKIWVDDRNGTVPKL